MGSRTAKRRGGRGSLLTCVIALSMIASACADPGSSVLPPATTAGPTTTPTTDMATTTGTSVTTTAPTTGPIDPPPVAKPVAFDENGFNDHTVPRLASVGEFRAMAAEGVGGQAVVKFTIPQLLDDREGPRWMDSEFFSLHDEWYWFRLLNGQPVPGIDVNPLAGNTFDTIGDIYSWARTIPTSRLPLDLRFVGESGRDEGRLYSSRYYAEGLGDGPRNYGLGSLVHIPADAERGERWLIELEFSDDPGPDEVAAYFERLQPTLPPEIAEGLEWVIRSPAQEATATRMRIEQLPYNDRVVRYREIVPQGEVAVYNAGVAAGRLLYVGEGGAELTDATAHDIVIVDRVPDWLPAAAALITDAPQTPLAHVNLLARNRGIPNASQAGVTLDPGLRQASRIRAHAVVRAVGDELEVALISREQYERWQRLEAKPRVEVPTVDLGSLDYVLSLDDLTREVTTEIELDRWRPIIGGKSAGFLTLLSVDGVTTPDTPVAITVRGYAEHLAQVDGELSALLSSAAFSTDVRARHLLLEGPESFAELYPDDERFAADLIAASPEGTPLGDVLAVGGFVQLIRDEPIDRGTLGQITDALEAEFGDLARTQGLRFRSSSSVEDIEGFTGAGLYDSNTGFLDPDAQPDPNDHKRSIEWALKKTWASYWGFEAFEERRLENVDHRSGAMAVLVHARFDDDLERNNGVATVTLLPAGGWIAEINVQDGAVSVTNPDSRVVTSPEVIEMEKSASGVIETRRIEPSSLTSSEVLSDADLVVLLTQLENVAAAWRNRLNAGLPAAQRASVVTLDFEFKTMRSGWPALRSGVEEPERLVVKQARSLDPGLRGFPREVLDLEIPRDVLARARLVERLECDGRMVAQVYTDPLSPPSMGFADSPFEIRIDEPPDNGARDLDECVRTTLYSSPEQRLVDLVATGEKLELSG